MKFYVETGHPVAVDSLDHIYPLGAERDNTRSPRFNEKLRRFPGGVLDLGCAGGGFVHDMVKEGRPAVGLDGHDYNFKFGSKEWGKIPDNLFMCDITKPYTVHAGDGMPFQFEIVTAFEVLEHIEERDLPMLFENVRRHMHPEGIFLGTASLKMNPHPYHPQIYMHPTVKPMEWWLEVLEREGFVFDEGLAKYFGGDILRPIQLSSWLFMRRISNFGFGIADLGGGDE